MFSNIFKNKKQTYQLYLICFGVRLMSEVEPMEDEGVDSEDADVGDSEGDGEGSDVEEDLQLEMEDNRAKADEMGVEHLATLERLRQNQRQDYLKVRSSYLFTLLSKAHCVLY